jgi:putative endonuclease
VTKKLLGRLGEKLALRHLQNKGYKIIERNFSSKFGEIDLIALEGGELVFIEVKSRRGKVFGLPEEAVTPVKIRHLEKAGFHYKSLHPELPETLRIDVLALNLSNEGKLERIKVFKNITR